VASLNRKATAEAERQALPVGKLPSEVVRYRSKTTYEIDEAALRDDLGVRKLSDKQRTAIKLAILFQMNEEARQYQAELERSFKQARNGSAVLGRIDSWAERALGWTVLRRYDEIVRSRSRPRLRLPDKAGPRLR
jgi:hypothetical protein